MKIAIDEEENEADECCVTIGSLPNLTVDDLFILTVDFSRNCDIMQMTGRISFFRKQVG